MTKPVSRSLFVLLILVLVSSAMAGQIQLLVRIGTDSEGNPLFRPADSTDTSLSGLSDLIQGSPAIQDASRYYDAVQKDKLTQSLKANGVPDQNLAAAVDATPTQPTFIEVSSSNGGSYNDWNGRFSVQSPGGQVRAYTQPRIVFPLGGQVATSGDPGLIAQTLIHEMGHGSMCQCYICQSLRSLPDSPNLGKSHSGGSVSDPQLAFIEGWAEFVGAYFSGRTTIAQDPAGAIDSNWYAKGANGQMKSGRDLPSCEGWVATVLYKVATAAKQDNALWKMTQVMSRTAPQSMTDLLASLAASCPELAPVIDQQLSALSGGQVPNLATLRANAGLTGAVAIANLAPPATTVDTSTGAVPAVNVVTNPGTAPAVNATADPATLASPESVSILQDLQTLRTRYAQEKQELDGLAWWHIFKRWRLKDDLSSIQDEYSKESALLPLNVAQAQTATHAAAPAAPSTTPDATAATSGTYTPLIQALRSGGIDQARRALEAHRRAEDNRNAQRQLAPPSER